MELQPTREKRPDQFQYVLVPDPLGVLTLISLLEHRIGILTDRAILDPVPPETWNNLLALIQDGVHKGNPVESLCRAITFMW
ncbi:MAG: hypothetical protein NPIRA03_24270 [Nitrospirales bacterium]|nr:MAG: hypothetical protein NPIRA03_24270 [Nitrospirales bacterium]